MPAVRKSGKVFRPLRRLHAATQLKLSQKHRDSMGACLRTVSRLAGNHEGTSNTKREKRSVLSGLGPGSYVMTSQGELPVEWLAVGDQLVTRDHGLQPLRHIERTRGTEDNPLPDPLVLPLPEESISRQSGPLYMSSAANGDDATSPDRNSLRRSRSRLPHHRTVTQKNIPLRQRATLGLSHSRFADACIDHGKRVVD